jgi:hypothetical protein
LLGPFGYKADADHRRGIIDHNRGPWYIVLQNDKTTIGFFDSFVAILVKCLDLRSNCIISKTVSDAVGIDTFPIT